MFFLRLFLYMWKLLLLSLFESFYNHGIHFHLDVKQIFLTNMCKGQMLVLQSGRLGQLIHMATDKFFTVNSNSFYV